MAKTSFLNISSEECRSEYLKVVANSEMKLCSAKHLALNGDYNSAVSLLIISNEELIKALILFLDGHGFRLRSVSGMKSLFENHRLRYLFAMVFSIMASFGEDLVQMIVRLNSNPKLFNRLIRIWEENQQEIAKKYFFKKMQDIEEEISFFSRLDEVRQKGLYSDFATNSDFNELEYHSFYSKITVVNSVVYGLMEGFQMKETSEQVQKMLRQFKSEKFYDRMAELIKKINKPQVNTYADFLSELRVIKEDVMK